MAMTCLSVISTTLALAILAPQGHAVDVSPVNKVMKMMSEMKTKGETMMEEEAKTYAAYTQWVADQENRLEHEIETAGKDIERLLADAALADNDVHKLRASNTQLETDMFTAQKEKTDATVMRKKEHAEYVKLSTDYSESVTALKQALQTLKSKNYDVAQATELIQKLSVSKPGMRRVLAAFLQGGEGTTKGGFLQESTKGGPAAAAYEFQSGGIIRLLEEFQKKFQGELEQVEAEEAHTAGNYEEEMEHLDDVLANFKKALEEKSVLKAKRASDSAGAKSDLASTKEDLAEDRVTLRDMKVTFAAKTDTFKTNQELRKQELAAISKAIEIFSDPKLSTSYHKHTVWGRIDKPSSSSFLQVHSARAGVSAGQVVTQFLKKKAALLSSEVLKEAAVQAASSPFDKVVNMVKELINKLEEQAAAEADHKQWCMDQAKSNKIKLSKKASKVNKLEATIDSLTETVADTVQRIATLGKEQADLQTAMSEATLQRQREKADNSATVQDATAGEEVTKRALAVLQEFYSSQGSFLQESGSQAPEMAAYKLMGSSSGGIMGMLEAISSDFARLHTDTMAAEMRAASEYNVFMKDAKDSKKLKANLERDTRYDLDSKEWEKAKTAQDLESTHEELDKAKAYKKNLVPVCQEVGVSYIERGARRKDEIEALKEAYKLLDQKQ